MYISVFFPIIVDFVILVKKIKYFSVVTQLNTSYLWYNLKIVFNFQEYIIFMNIYICMSYKYDGLERNGLSLFLNYIQLSPSYAESSESKRVTIWFLH